MSVNRQAREWEEAELLLSIAQADRGETTSAEEVLERLARRHG